YTQSAICLLMIVTTGPENAGVSHEDFSASGTRFFTLTLQNNATQDVRGLVDGWGLPLAYALYPTTVPAPTPAPPLPPPTPAILSAGKDKRYGNNPFDFVNDPDAADNLCTLNPL